ncbi:hypothetical protein ACFV2N_44370 [Streptomyces sp. NPDC059680]|uniref:hypothetical protein n=1 Tax=Streptomyces sp. NPDC059680 TaxID=3346904 RepID=UPI00369308BC
MSTDVCLGGNLSVVPHDERVRDIGEGNLSSRSVGYLHRQPRETHDRRGEAAPQPALQDAEVPPGRPVIGSAGWYYEAHEDHGTVWKVNRGKEGGWDVVLDWAPYVSERLVLIGEDGKSAGRYYTITIGADTLTKSLSDLRTADGWNDFSDDSGAASRAIREVLINIITDQGKRLPRTPVVAHTGWHRLPDVGLTYVYADGRCYPSGRSVRVIGAPEPVRQAAAPLDRTATDKECRQAVTDIAAHGWASLMTLAVGARSLAYSLRPVSAAFVLDAAPNSGKTSAANTARSLLLTPRPHAWPPVPTKGMSSTATDIECALDFEGDMPTLLDDIPLTRASSASQVREMERKLELVIRAAGNATEIKGRRNRDLTAKPANRIRSIPVIAAQMLPATMQESLYRRSVVIYLSRDGGEVDWRWYKAGGGQSLTVPLRTIGDKIIAHLHDQSDADGYLEGLEREALERLSPHVQAVLPEPGDTMDGVITGAAALLSGLGLVAAVTNTRMSDLIGVVAAPLARSLARQAACMEAQSTAQDGVATAVGEVLRNAFSRGRLHIRDEKGVVHPAVTGQVEQDQGLSPRRDGTGWEGKGPAAYWLPQRGPALGITTKNLNMLLKASGDSRVNCYVDRSLPDALLQADAILRNNSQKDRVASHRVRVGAENLRLLLLRPELIWDF